MEHSIDREKVIKAIDICLGHGKCDDCGYRIKGGYSTMDCRKPMMRDALALLKEQEAELQKGRYYSDVFDIGYKAGKESIVLCKDCKRRGTYDCPVYVGGDGMYSEPDDWFCADGVMRE